MRSDEWWCTSSIAVRQESQESSQEIDDVLTLLQTMKSKDERKETCEFLWAAKRERTLNVVQEIQRVPKSFVVSPALLAAKAMLASVKLPN